MRKRKKKRLIKLNKKDRQRLVIILNRNDDKRNGSVNDYNGDYNGDYNSDYAI